MTISPPPTDAREAGLKSCPFCGEKMRTRAHSAFHPQNDCWLATAGEHGTYELDETEYSSWNRRALLSTPPPQSGWRTMDSAPKDEVILVADREGNIEKVSWGDCCPGYPNSPRMRWCVAMSYGEHGYHTVDDPTHWRPLPKPPEIE